MANKMTQNRSHQRVIPIGFPIQVWHLLTAFAPDLLGSPGLTCEIWQHKNVGRFVPVEVAEFLRISKANDSKIARFKVDSMIGDDPAVFFIVNYDEKFVTLNDVLYDT